MKKGIVFFDIDGTLMGFDKHIPSDGVQAIRMLQSNGYFTAINTGRPYSHIEPAILAIGFDGYVCSCGGHILCNGETVFYKRPSVEACRKIIELNRECCFSPLYEAEEGMFFDPSLPMSPGTLKEKRHFASRGFDVDYDINTPGFRFDKFCAYAMPGANLEKLKKGAEPYFEVIGRENEMVEFPVKGCNKGIGVRTMCELLDIDLKNSYAVGDGKNDLPMFRAVTHSILMGNGDPDVYEEAEYITTGMDEGGIMNAMKHFGLI